MQAGVACASVSGAGWEARQACVLQRPLGDGAWHTVAAERWGHSLVVRVDDGDDWRCNETLVGLTALASLDPPKPLRVDRHEGVTVGGLPEFRGVELVAVHDDLQDSECCSAALAHTRRGTDDIPTQQHPPECVCVALPRDGQIAPCSQYILSSCTHRMIFTLLLPV